VRDSSATVLLLIPSHSYRTSDFMRAASDLDINVIVGIDTEFIVKTDQESVIALDFSDPDKAAETISQFRPEIDIDAILAVDDAGTLIAAKASQILELPHNSVSSVELTRDKYALRTALSVSRLPSPGYKLFDIAQSEDDLRVIGDSMKYPVVLKPRGLSGSQGIIRADSCIEFTEAFSRIKGILESENSREECAADLLTSILVEDYVSGPEFALEGVLNRGDLTVLALFDKPDPLIGPFFEETIYVTPTRYPDDVQVQIISTVQSACRNLGLTHGPVHAEVRLEKNEVFLIDLAGRSIGGLCARTLSFGSGLSLEEIILTHAVGDDINQLNRESLAAGVMMIPIPAAGIFQKVSGVDKAENISGIESVSIIPTSGDEVIPLPDGNEYLGFIFGKGKNPQTVEKSLREAHDQLDFEIT
jgi:biotin carboxylase